MSFKRICNYLEQEELDKYVHENIEDAIDSDGNRVALAIKLTEANLGWAAIEAQSVEETDSSISPTVKAIPKKYESLAGNADVEQGASATTNLSSRSTRTLANINLSVPEGSLVGIVGPVGSGKSSLLCSLLGELHLHSGSVNMRGTVAYCDQRPWIINDTVQGNILLGLPLNQVRLDHAIYAANLGDDLKVLPGGLNTQIGEKGVNLSGGQKARVSFARAVYADSDVYLLDDPLSAVDAHVGQFLFRESIFSLLKTKTRLLVTHQVQYLPYCDLIVALKDGEVAFQGTYGEYRTSAEFPSATAVESANEKSASEGELEDTPGRVRLSSDWDVSRQAHRIEAEKQAIERHADERSSTIMTTEERDEGTIDSSIYATYAKSGGVFLFVIVVSLMEVAQLLGVGALFWLSIWGSQGDLSEKSNVFYLNVLAVIYCLSLVCTVTAIITQVSHRLAASLNLYMNVLKSVMNAPMSFFDSTPIG